MTALLRVTCLALAIQAAPAMAAKPGSPTTTPTAPTTSTPYTYSVLGDPSLNVTATPQTPSSPSIVLMGGGYDVGEAFRWMIRRAGVTPTTRGRFVIIRATGTDAYNPYVYSTAGIDKTTPKNYELVGGKDLGLTSVETLVIPTRAAASDSRLTAIIGKASAIWIAGGDQADYYNYWKATPLDATLQAAVAKGIPIGGTSAGTAMLGEYAFMALRGTVTSSQALTDPYNRYITIDPLNTTSKTFSDPSAFMTPLPKVIADPHFNTRDRLGRLVTFVARIGKSCTGGAETFNNVFGIGIDEETALLISTTSGGQTIAKLAVNPYDAANFSQSSYTPANSAYFVKLNKGASTCASGQPLVVPDSGITLYRMSAPKAAGSSNSSFETTDIFDLSKWKNPEIKDVPYLDSTGITGPNTYESGGGLIKVGPALY